MLTPEDQHELQRLAQDHLPLRMIARRLGRDVKTIRRALGRPPQPPAPAKLAPYHALIQAGFAQGLHAPRILREIRARGYSGGLTILKTFLRTLGPPRAPKPRIVRRFETAPGEEAQSDWSPYRVRIADRPTVVHAFSLILGFCRRLFVRFFRDERLPTLLWAHQMAFADHGGLCRRIAYDNQTAITLGRVGGRPRWHPTFLDFARHYGFEPAVGRPGHKERRGKVERPFLYLEQDFLRGRIFASWDDLHTQCRQWLDTVANVRVHGTTRRRVDEAYAQEQPCLIALPTVAYPAARLETRTVQQDGAIPIDSSFYPVPAARPGQRVSARVDPERVHLLDAAGHVVAVHAVPDHPTRLSAPPPPAGARPAFTRPVLQGAFLARFPEATAFLEGLARRMTTLTPIHLRALIRLADLYGAAAMTAALAHATAYRNFNARAVERILRRAHPTVVPAPLPLARTLRPDALGALDDVEPGSPQDYTLDTMAPTGGPDHDA
ncbi:MAG TPA: IS21 family transposase [Candidatus Binatia bacterium]|nr:IS21 family transposase [Candidatus Binatia bacterium]